MQKRWVSGFIILHVILITVWSLPNTNHPGGLARFAMRLREELRSSIEPIMLSTGLWQGWDMFAPNPLSSNFDVDAEIRFQDGSQKIWVFPKMERLGFMERYQKERYRKWREQVRIDDNAVIWRDTARWIAQQFRNPKNPPVYVSLSRHWTPILEPVSGDYQPLIAVKKHVNQHTFFRTRLTEKDLS